MVKRLWSWWVLAVLVSLVCQHTAVADDGDEDEADDGGEEFDTPGDVEDEDRTDRSVHSVRPCGVPFKGPDRFVVGGQNADRLEYPWMAQLKRRDIGTHHCGGSLITDRHVLTAAHCFDSHQPHTLVVRLGEYNLLRHQGNTVDYWISDVKKHPDYTKQRNDVAVILIDGIAPYNAAIRPICLPPRFWVEYAGQIRRQDPLDYTGQIAVGTGWGFSDSEERTDFDHVLEEVNLRIWSTDDCSTHAPENDLCAGLLDERDTCAGDSGGPLSLQIYGQWSVVGIVSRGPFPCGIMYPGIYTRVDAYLNWINFIIATVR